MSCEDAIASEHYLDITTVEKRLAYDDEQLAAIGQAHPECQRLQTIPGIGPVTATALIAAIGDVTQFKNGRQLAAWLGLVPREHSTGGTPRWLGISKRGDVQSSPRFPRHIWGVKRILPAHHPLRNSPSLVPQ